MKADRAEVEKAVAIFFDGIKEVRIPGTTNGVMAGVFDDPAKLVDAILSDAVQVQGCNIYWTLQRLDPSKCKVTNAIHGPATTTTKDADVLEYRWLLVDCDPIRECEDKEVSSTSYEKAASLDVALSVFSLFDRLEYTPVIVDSGNGYHVLVPLEILNVDKANELVRDMLRVLNIYFGTSGANSLAFTRCPYAAKVDEGVFNPARIVKIPGTLAIKGPHAADRPHRLALIEHTPQITKRMNRDVFEEMLTELIGRLPADIAAGFQQEAAPRRPANDAYMEIVLEETHQFLDLKKIRAREKPDGADIMFPMPCPDGDNHDSGSSGPTEAILTVKSNGDMTYYCAHPSCTIYSYADGTYPIQKFKKFLDPVGEFKWTLPPVEPQTTEYGVEGVKAIQKAVADTKAEKPYFKKEKVPGRKKDFVFGKANYFGSTLGGWIPRSSISLICGSSGIGKTTLMMPALLAQEQRKDVLGHPTFGLPWLMITRDRGGYDLEELLDDLKLKDEVRAHIKSFKHAKGKLATFTIKQLIEAEEVMPAVVFIEGADIMVADQSKMDPVDEFIGDLSVIAEYYHIAFICSVGAPKLKKDEAFISDRDTAFGSSMWGRGTSTMLLLSKKPMPKPRKGERPVLDENHASRRVLNVHPRRGQMETFDLIFDKGGALVLAEEQDPLTVEESAEDGWLKREGYWTAKDFQDAMGGSRATAYRRIQMALELGKITEKRGPKGAASEYTKKGVGVSSPESETPLERL